MYKIRKTNKLLSIVSFIVILLLPISCIPSVFHPFSWYYPITPFEDDLVVVVFVVDVVVATITYTVSGLYGEPAGPDDENGGDENGVDEVDQEEPTTR